MWIITRICLVLIFLATEVAFGQDTLYRVKQQGREYLGHVVEEKTVLVTCAGVRIEIDPRALLFPVRNCGGKHWSHFGDLRVFMPSWILDPFTYRYFRELEEYANSPNLITEPTAGGVALGGLRSDLAVLNEASLRAMCDEGSLVRLTDEEVYSFEFYSDLINDFLPLMNDCGVAKKIIVDSYAYTLGQGWDAVPSALTDIFAADRFPGPRGLPRRAQGNLEMALLADGIPPSEVYQALQTSAGVDRALGKLASIRHSIVWVRNSSAAIDLLDTSQGGFALVDAAAFLSRSATGRQEGGLLWGGSLWTAHYWGIPDDAENLDSILHFLSAWNVNLRRLGWTQWLGLEAGSRGDPDRATATDLFPPDDFFDSALGRDARFWDEHGEQLQQRFEAWLDE